jgi:5-hydroxyisourate hydrolase
MMGKLTTHVLDTVQGGPAAGVQIDLYRVDPQTEAKMLVKTLITNADGRTDAPFLAEDDLTIGLYEFVFAIGAYFAAQVKGLPEPPFLDRVPIRFGIADPTAHYHVPLLASPWAYSTYRGS